MSIAHATSDTSSMGGEVIQPGDPGYDEARALYNAMIDKCPAAISGAARRGGRRGRPGLRHAAPGSSSPSAAAVTAAPGSAASTAARHRPLADARRRRRPRARAPRGSRAAATLGDVDARHPRLRPGHPGRHHLDAPGVGGLTLGGGHGYLARKHGLTVDNLLDADVVLADGELVTASARRAPRPVLGAARRRRQLRHRHLVHLPGAPGAQGLWRDRPVPARGHARRAELVPRLHCRRAEDLYGWFGVLTVPPRTSVPRGAPLQKACCGIVWCCTGEPAACRRGLGAAARVRAAAHRRPGAMPIAALQTTFDRSVPAGLQWYWRADFFERSVTTRSRAREVRREAPDAASTMHLYPIDGAVHDVGQSDTAFAYRYAGWAAVIVGVDPDPASPESCRLGGGLLGGAPDRHGGRPTSTS